MYYQKFSEINKAFHDNEFSTVASMFAVVIFYMGLLTFACITLAIITMKLLH